MDQNLKPRLTKLLERFAPGRDYNHLTTLDQLDELVSSGSAGIGQPEPANKDTREVSPFSDPSGQIRIPPS